MTFQILCLAKRWSICIFHLYSTSRWENSNHEISHLKKSENIDAATSSLTFQMLDGWRARLADLNAVDVSGWTSLCCVRGCPKHARMFSSISDLYYQMPVASSCHNETCLWTLPNVPWEANLLLAEKYWSRVRVKQANKPQAWLFKIQLQPKVVCPSHQRSHLCRQ